jgi:hypothetical protein
MADVKKLRRLVKSVLEKYNYKNEFSLATKGNEVVVTVKNWKQNPISDKIRKEVQTEKGVIVKFLCKNGLIE